jgi:archaellum component FlaC
MNEFEIKYALLKEIGDLLERLEKADKELEKLSKAYDEVKRQLDAQKSKRD